MISSSVTYYLYGLNGNIFSAKSGVTTVTTSSMKLLALALQGVSFLLAISSFAMDYSSDGFSAKVHGNGRLLEVSYKGKTLLRNCQVEGAYALDKGDAKHDARFFQAWDYTGSRMTTKSILANKTIGNGAQCETEILLAPEEITFKMKVTTLVELKTYMSLFRYDFNIPAEVVGGRGFKQVANSGLETFAIFPAAFNKDFKTGNGKSLAFSLPERILTISSNEKSIVGFYDCRAWGEKSVQATVDYAMKWSPELITYPARNVFEWEFKISLDGP